MKRRKKQYIPQKSETAVRSLRRAFGLPIYSTNLLRPPFGYSRSKTNPHLFIPKIRLLRALREGYKAADNGYSISVILKWMEQNTGHTMDNSHFSKLYHTVPVYAEIEKPLDERRKLYQAALQKAEEEAEGAYQDYIEQSNRGSSPRRKTAQDLEAESQDLGSEDFSPE